MKIKDAIYERIYTTDERKMVISEIMENSLII